MSRINWNEYFIAQSVLASLRATCTRLKVGAVIVRENRIIASGYNGSVADSVHCIDEGCKVVNGHCVRTVHAEANALLQCAKFGVPTNNTSLYVTHFPCLQCTKLIIQSGIKEIFYLENYRNDPLAEELFVEANIKVEKITLQAVKVDEHYKLRNQLLDELYSSIKENVHDESILESIEEKYRFLQEKM